MSSVIKIENLWKEYRLGVIGHDTLREDLQSWWAKVRDKEDPNSEIIPMMAGQEEQIEGDHFWALRDINLEVKEGEVLGIIGKNGAGKSTLLKILSRVTAPTKGSIKVKGRIACLLEVGTGFHPELTGRENIFMNGTILGMSKQEVMGKVDEIIEFSGVEGFVDTPVKRYSSGMRVRLGFAVAAHLEPEILIVDEVLSVGDAEFQKKCIGKMKDVSSRGRTVIFVSHNMQSVQRLCTSSVLLRNGGVAETGDTYSIVSSYLADNKEVNINKPILPEMHKKSNPGLEINCIELINSNGDISKSIDFDESYRIRISYKIYKENNNYVIGINFFSQENILITAASSRDKFRLHGSSGSYSLDLVVNNNMLTPGKINLQAVVKCGKQLVDLIDGVGIDILSVSRTGRLGYGAGAGFLRLNEQWKYCC
ncbi:MAG: ATP-binding cassette domain-containing protein [Candidatus Electrothrix sp. ATG2]|nr:ATP-binding cassette domain-containing protein [Candidatus Electrothrix sp. ATG2]